MEINIYLKKKPWTWIQPKKQKYMFKSLSYIWHPCWNLISGRCLGTGTLKDTKQVDNKVV